jgi:hypothetical protein
MMKKIQKHSIWGLVFISFFILKCNSYNYRKEENTEIKLITFSKIDKAREICKGENVKVAIIDWQFDLKGKEAKKYIYPVSMVPDEEIGELKPWHGEWMAEIVHLIAPESKIIPVRARSLDSGDYEEYLINGIYYAADHGAVAVSSSMGPLKQSDALKKAIDYAEQKGMIFVNVHPEYYIEEDGKIKLCETGECDGRIIHAGIVSSPDHPVIAEANRDIYTWPYDPDAKYEDGWGYSNAPPVVLGVIALMKSVNPNLSINEIKQIIIKTADEKNGFMVLNALAAVESARKLFNNPE